MNSPFEKQCKLTSFKCLLEEQPTKIKGRWKQMPLATSRRGQCMWEGNMDKCCLDAGWGKAPLADTCLNPNWDPGLSSGSHWFKKGPTTSVSLYPETLEFIWLHTYEFHILRGKHFYPKLGIWYPEWKIFYPVRYQGLYPEWMRRRQDDLWARLALLAVRENASTRDRVC